MGGQVEKKARGRSARYRSIHQTQKKRRTPPGHSAARSAVQQKPDPYRGYSHARGKAYPPVAEQIVRQEPHQNRQTAVDAHDHSFAEAEQERRPQPIAPAAADSCRHRDEKEGTVQTAHARSQNQARQKERPDHCRNSTIARLESQGRRRRCDRKPAGCFSGGRPIPTFGRISGPGRAILLDTSAHYDPDWVGSFYDEYGDLEWDRRDTDRVQSIEFEIHCDYLRTCGREIDRVLEIGAGSGRFTRELARLCRHVTVADISPVQLELNRQHAQQLGYEDSVDEFVECDLLRLSERFRPGSFEAVLLPEAS